MTNDEKFNSLTKKQVIWAEHFALNRNASAAASHAGYSSKTVRNIGYRNIRNKLLMEYVADFREESWSEDKMELSEVLATLSQITRDADAKTSARVQAANALAKIMGWNQPEKIDLNITKEMIESYERAILR